MMRKVVFILAILTIIAAAGIAGWLFVVEGDKPAAEPTPTSTPTDTPTPTCEPGIVCVNAEQLCDDYDANEVAADAKYKGKDLEVYGEVKRIESFLDDIYLTLDCGWFSYVWCYFDEADTDKLMDVVEGDHVKVRGKGAGEAIIDLLDQPKLEHCKSVQVVETPGEGDDDGWCFIATATYGSPMDSRVDVLRQFRDSYLVTNPGGRGLVSVYYTLSPPVAQFIDDNPGLKPVVRAGLWPAVAVSTVVVTTTLAQKVAILGGFALVSIILVWLIRRRAFTSTIG
jgi:hypothetical protein